MPSKEIIEWGKNKLTRVLLILRAAAASFQRMGSARGAAGMAYYTLLSFFPLLIVLVTIGSYFVDDSEASNKVAQLIISVFPVSQGLVEVNIGRILVLRNSVGIVGLIVLFWSGSNAFSMMVHHITSAWPEAERRTFFEKRLLGLAMMIVIILLLFVLMLSSTLLNVLVRYQHVVPGLDLLFSSWLWHFGAKVMYWVVPFLFFYSLYRIIPMGRVPIKAAGFSALGITILWRLASNGFQWYLGSSFARYEVIFGSLSAIVVLLLWIYISSLILFFGAHLCAASSGKMELGTIKGINSPRFRN
ncbi:MAG: YihY/virulence factor BrkB family protein [Anaerolineales bacterium]|nr:YihY/virulence factor BrkB family protein [Anaerolineales bacterium]